VKPIMRGGHDQCLVGDLRAASCVLPMTMRDVGAGASRNCAAVFLSADLYGV
jgi:hypothetical protein